MSPSPPSPTPGQVFRSQPLPLLLLQQLFAPSTATAEQASVGAPNLLGLSTPLLPPLFSWAAAAQHNHRNINNKTQQQPAEVFSFGGICILQASHRSMTRNLSNKLTNIRYLRKQAFPNSQQIILYPSTKFLPQLWHLYENTQWVLSLCLLIFMGVFHIIV